MKSASMIFSLIAILALAACSERVEESRTAVNETAAAAAEQSAMPAEASTDANVWKGTVLETMNSGGYSYVKMVLDGEEAWVAGPETAGLAVGDEVQMAPGMMMSNFHAKSLDRDFAEIYFVGSLEKAGHEHPAAASDHPTGSDHPTSSEHPTAGEKPAGGTELVVEKTVVEGVKMADGGFTVAGIHSGAQALADQTVLVRGRVVKFSQNIMGTNWIHIQDGTGDGASADLTVTSGARVEVGDLILVKGPLSVDKDFGAGYRYSVIIEGAEVTKE
jgi:hypothetical protein